MGVVGRWLLAVGCLVLLLAQILHNSRNSIDAHTQRFFSGLKYLDYFIVRPDLDWILTGLNWV